MKNVRSRLLATVAIVGLAAPAYAADMAVKAPPPVAPVPTVTSWTGFYVGTQFGSASFDPQCSQSNNDPFGQFGNIACSSVPVSASAMVGMPRNSSAAGGFRAGYDWQYSALVLGVVGDLNWANLSSSVSAPPEESPPGSTATTKLDRLASIRGRLGWALNDLLVYGTGGVAWAHVTGSNGMAGTCCGNWAASADWIVPGAVAGGGFEYRVNQHVSFTGEVLWYGGFGTKTVSGNCSCFVGATTYTTNFQVRDVLLATAGLNFRF
jgi:outer membrane immunogenic protein